MCVGLWACRFLYAGQLLASYKGPEWSTEGQRESPWRLERGLGLAAAARRSAGVQCAPVPKQIVKVLKGIGGLGPEWLSG